MIDLHLVLLSLASVWVAWVVLELGAVGHGGSSRVDTVHDDETGSVERSHWAGNWGRELLAEKRHVGF